MSATIYAATSCLQGRPAADVARHLLAVGADGVQLTAGCVPQGDVAAALASQGVPTRTHHGYHPDAVRTPVWSPQGQLLSVADSIHPPRSHLAEQFWAAVRAGHLDGVAVEVMYPGYTLGDTPSIRAAMHAGLHLAVDVSHLHIGLCSGHLDAATAAALYAYDRVAEVHLSANDGRRDTHRVCGTDSYGFGWAAERASDGVPLIVESYLHRHPTSTARRLFDTVREATR